MFQLTCGVVFLASKDYLSPNFKITALMYVAFLTSRYRNSFIATSAMAPKLEQRKRPVELDRAIEKEMNLLKKKIGHRENELNWILEEIDGAKEEKEKMEQFIAQLMLDKAEKEAQIQDLKTELESLGD